MNDDYIFDEEIDEEAAEELRKKRERENQAAGVYYEQGQPNGQNTYANNGQQNGQYNGTNNGQPNSQNTYTNNGPQYSQNNGSQNGPGYGPNYNSQYNQNYRPNGPVPNGKKKGTGFAVASLVLGIISLVLFCSCINMVTAIIAIIFGIVHLASYDLSQGKHMAIAGIITAAISIILFIGIWTWISSNSNLDNMTNSMYDFYYGTEDIFNDSIDDYFDMPDDYDYYDDDTL